MNTSVKEREEREERASERETREWGEATCGEKTEQSPLTKEVTGDIGQWSVLFSL